MRLADDAGQVGPLPVLYFVVSLSSLPTGWVGEVVVVDCGCEMLDDWILSFLRVGAAD